MQKRKRKLISENHKASFKKYGFCTLPGCKCFDRKPIAYHRVGKIVACSKPVTDLEIRNEKKRLARIKKNREKGYNLKAGWR